ncbi:6-pyruvoyl tetrahydropterin synthase-like protein [Ruminiclostridium sufflavum DSM 19573]|uniref:6-carboxy-5,6,7,8-tetrahydropterin synthase n=1 Tax=Ruminiclostridium sufflavum DSM 19573 TaxID=1121337 RepID=A0A318XJK5_9FIRM|nr:6-carboxytetrahydropterin synthase [Ruminiclostridium sufflavum]PYG85019.1 6-pyruvoyl tetrahydropterin synthase-like protein [Ruminiclostridium sufflavum DSM 19573]
MFEGYKLKYRLNAKHSLLSDTENIHPHTFEISLFIEQGSKYKQVSFNALDKIVKPFLFRYQNSYLNNIPPFNMLEPTIENMGETFYEELKTILNSKKFNLIQLEISETPLRVYLISDRLMFSSITRAINSAI